MQILLQHITTVTPLLEEDLKSSEITLLPRSVAMVQKQGTSLSLRHRITVEGSWPRADCYITCEEETRSVKWAGLKPNTAKAETGKCVSHSVQPPAAWYGGRISRLVERMWDVIYKAFKPSIMLVPSLPVTSPCTHLHSLKVAPAGRCHCLSNHLLPQTLQHRLLLKSSTPCSGNGTATFLP